MCACTALTQLIPLLAHRRDTFCCLLVNCVAVSAMVVLLAVSLHTPQPVIFIGVGNILPPHTPPTPPTQQQVKPANANKLISDHTLAHSPTHSQAVSSTNQHGDKFKSNSSMNFPLKKPQLKEPLPTSQLKDNTLYKPSGFYKRSHDNHTLTGKPVNKQGRALADKNDPRPASKQGRALSDKDDPRSANKQGHELSDKDPRPASKQGHELSGKDPRPASKQGRALSDKDPRPASKQGLALSDKDPRPASKQGHALSDKDDPRPASKQGRALSDKDPRPASKQGHELSGKDPRPASKQGRALSGKDPRPASKQGRALSDKDDPWPASKQGHALSDKDDPRPASKQGHALSDKDPRPASKQGRALSDKDDPWPANKLGHELMMKFATMKVNPSIGSKADPVRYQSVGRDEQGKPPGPQYPGTVITGRKPPLNTRLQTKVVEDTKGQFAGKHDVLPLVAFFDSRPRYSHSNSTVLLVQVRDVKRQRYNRVIGCGVDDVRAPAYRVKPLFVYRNWIRSNVPNLTHSEAVVTCYDLPSRNGSKAYVLYRPYRIPYLLKVYSERPVFVPGGLGPMRPWSLVVCTTVYNRPPWLSEWLRYQQTIGVDYIHLYAQQSFIDQGGMSNPELQKLVSSQRLRVDVRNAYLNSSEVYYYSQPLHYQDCLLRFRGVYEFAMLIDTDDFLVPRVPDHPDVHFYLKHLFRDNIASVKLDWVRYFPSCGLTTPPDKILDGNLTHHLATHRCYKEYVKSIHRLEYVTEAAVHEVTYLIPGYKKAIASNSTVYIAHIRKTDGCHANSTGAVQVAQHENKVD